MAAPLRRQSLRRRGTPAGRPQPQRPPPPVQPKLAVAGPAELVTCDQTIEHTLRCLEADAGLGHPQGAPSGAGRPVDLAAAGRCHPTPPGPATGRRPTPTVGTAA